MNRKKLEKRYAYGNLMILTCFRIWNICIWMYCTPHLPPLPPIDFKKCALACIYEIYGIYSCITFFSRLMMTPIATEM